MHQFCYHLSGADYIVYLLQFHNDPLAAVNACYEGDTVIICPGHYVVDGVFYIADSVELEGRRFASVKVQKTMSTEHFKLALHKDLLRVGFGWSICFFLQMFLFLLIKPCPIQDGGSCFISHRHFCK